MITEMQSKMHFILFCFFSTIWSCFRTIRFDLTSFIWTLAHGHSNRPCSSLLNTNITHSSCVSSFSSPNLYPITDGTTSFVPFKMWDRYFSIRAYSRVCSRVRSHVRFTTKLTLSPAHISFTNPFSSTFVYAGKWLEQLDETKYHYTRSDLPLVVVTTLFVLLVPGLDCIVTQ